MALSDFEILQLGPWQEDAPWPYEAQLYFARAVEEKALRNDDALIRQMLEALESSSPHTDATYAWQSESWTAKRAAAITAARARLATTAKESPCSTK